MDERRTRDASCATTEARITGLAWTLGVLAAVSLFVGLDAFIWPHSFYDHALGVNRLPPYNQHLLTDVGGFYLGFAVLFAWAAVDRGRALVLATCAAWIVVQALHLTYHGTHLEHFNVATASKRPCSPRRRRSRSPPRCSAPKLGRRRTRGRGERDQAASRP